MSTPPGSVNSTGYRPLEPGSIKPLSRFGWTDKTGSGKNCSNDLGPHSRHQGKLLAPVLSGARVSCTDPFTVVSLKFSQFTHRTNIPQPRFRRQRRGAARQRDDFEHTRVQCCISETRPSPAPRCWQGIRDGEFLHVFCGYRTVSCCLQ